MRKRLSKTQSRLKKRSRSSSSTVVSGGVWLRGQKDGSSKGWAHGYHMGRCQRVLRDTPREEGVLWNTRVIYVKANGSPYTAIDDGIADGLSKLVREVTVVNPEDNVVALAQSTRPDLVLVLDAAGKSFAADKVDAIRQMGIRTAVWISDDPYHSDETMLIAPHYDYVFTLELNCVELYRQLGCKQVYYLPFAANIPTFVNSGVPTPYRKEICFIGSAFWNRVQLVDEIADYLKNKEVIINGYWWDRLKSYQLLADKIQGYWLSPEESAKYYHGAKIVINLHRSIDDASHNTNSRQIEARSLNPRLFEIAACGTLQLTDVREELSHFYTPGVELDTYASPQELMDKIDYYLNHEEERQQIALRGFSRTMREHTYRNRLIQLLTITQGEQSM
jgi:spore maturation protein CgeB